MPRSNVILRLQRGTVDARLILPIIELRLGWQKPLPMDAAQTIQRYGPDLKKYVLRHVRPTAPDGRPWAVTVRSLTPLAAQAPNAFVASSPDVQVDLVMTPPSGASADRMTLHYDVIFHRLITHTAIVSIASDWHNGLVGGPPVLLGTLRDTQPSLAIDRSQGSWLRGFAALFGLGARHIAEGTDHLLFLLALLLAQTPVYPLFRVVGACLTGVAASAWFLERALGWNNPVAPIVEQAAHALWLRAGLAVLSVGASLGCSPKFGRGNGRLSEES